MAHPHNPSSDADDVVPASQLGTEKPEAKYDSFYSPQNHTFYNSFEYAILKPSDLHIRLLRIYPHEANEDDNATIKCDLIDDVSLKEYTGKFTTISYCAGNSKNTETVLVNGVQFNAFANLGHALRQARHFWKTHNADRQLLLWADQICINQSNTPERSHQVGFMGKIYAAAEQVLVCLSTAETHGRGGMAWLLQFASDAWTHHDVKFTRMRERSIRFSGLSGSRSCDEDLHLGFESFRRTIFQSPWWKRAWVRQELMCSAKAYFLASYESLDFETLLEAMCILFEYDRGDKYHPHKELLDVLPESCQACVFGNTMSKGKAFYFGPASLLNSKACMIEYRLRNYSSLRENLSGVYECCASDPRDLIYACLGYSSSSYDIEPDYKSETSFCDVCCQLARNIIIGHDNLNALQMAIDYLPFGKDIEFPSWVPDWRRWPGIRESLPDNELQCRQYVSFHPDEQGRINRVLHARGILLGAENTLISTAKRDGLRSATYLNRPHPLEEEEEVWLLQGAHDMYRFRPKGQYHELVGRIFTAPTEWIEEVANLVENNHPDVQTIRIC
jgi:hypothetical protein